MSVRLLWVNHQPYGETIAVILFALKMAALFVGGFMGNPNFKEFSGAADDLTRRSNSLSMPQNIQELNKYLQGWVAYFGIQEFKN